MGAVDQQRWVDSTQWNAIGRFQHGADAVIAKVGGIVTAARIGNTEIHPAGGLVGVIVYGVRLPLAAGHASRTFDLNGAAVVGELRRIVESDKHLFAVFVAVVANAAAGWQRAVVDKVPRRRKIVLVPVTAIIQLAGAAVAVHGRF